MKSGRSIHKSDIVNQDEKGIILLFHLESSPGYFRLVLPRFRSFHFALGIPLAALLLFLFSLSLLFFQNPSSAGSLNSDGNHPTGEMGRSDWADGSDTGFVIERQIHRIQRLSMNLGKKTDEIYNLLEDDYEEGNLPCNMHRNSIPGVTLSNRVEYALCIAHLNSVLDKIAVMDSDLRYIPHTNPLSGRKLHVTSPYGVRPAIFRGGEDDSEFHKGIDLRARSGESISASADGYVESVKFSSRGYGNRVVIRHPGGFSTLYAHLSRILVNRGMAVHAGEPIGQAGRTGAATGPHLHYEVRFLEKHQNPGDFLTQ